MLLALLALSCQGGAQQQEAEAAAPTTEVATDLLDSAKFLPDSSCGSLDGVAWATDGSLFFWGWAQDPREHTPAEGVVLTLDGRQVGPFVPVLLDRPDVVAFTGETGLLASGWNKQLPEAAAATAGDRVVAYARLADGMLCRLGGEVAAPPRR